MKNILVRTSVAFAVLAGFLSVVVAEAPPAAATATSQQPKKIAIVIEENRSAANIFSCGATVKWNNPYLC